MARTWSSWLLVCMAQLWLLGVALMVVRHLVGWRAVRRIESAPSAPLSPEWQRRFEALRNAMGISRAVSVRLAKDVASPFTAYVLRPMICLPLEFLTELPRAQLEVLMAHELAHIRRLDWSWNAIQCVIESVLFHHPAMWWLSRRVREEREHACDDLAVKVCGDAVVLAEALSSLQRRHRMFDMQGPSLAATGGSLTRRVRHLLSAAPQRSDWRWPGAILLLLTSGTLLAMQVAPPSKLMTNLRFEGSSQGELTPGNYRQFTASYLGDPERRYRISMDASGHVDEAYTEDGHSKPVDDRVRAWVRSMSAMEKGAGQTAAAPPPAQPAHASPDSDEFRTLMSSIAADPQVTARTGSPARVDRASFHGSIHTWGSRDFHLWGVDDPVGGKASFTATFVGPKGKVDVAWAGKTQSGAWKADSFDLSAPAK
jgi:hypothetical protein